MRKLKEKSKTLPLDSLLCDEMNTFIDKVSITSEIKEPNIYPEFLLNSDKIDDHNFIENLKKIMHKEMNPLLELLSNLIIFRIAYRNFLISRELYMLGSFKGRTGHYYIFNTGIKNISCLLIGQSMRQGSDPGVCFLFFGYITLENVNKFGLFSSVFGSIDYCIHNEKYYFVSNWRRLKRSRLTFISDTFFSTLSTSIIDLNKINYSFITPNVIREYYTVRVITGLNSSQKAAELLADFKYIAMSSFSTYSRSAELLKDKFSGIYSSIFHIWIVYMAFRYLKFVLYGKENNLKLIELNVPEYIENIRNVKTVGGNVTLPMIWSTGLINNFNLFLNSLHLYVHTFKEPASLFHESIKSLKTIIKFDNLYNIMSKEEKLGISNKQGIQKLMNRFEIGFSSPFLYHMTKMFISENKVDFLKIINKIKFKKPIAHYSSTKASISDSNREIDKETRMKVHDALILNPEIANKTLIEHSINVLSNKNLKPLADICIKEQYGAKREFYVLDIHSKFSCKMIEEFFSEWAKLIPTECISVPGDLKMNKIDEMVNQIYIHAGLNHNSVFFINGDCTKWSASELMEAFSVMIYGMKTKLPLELYELLQGLMFYWKKKRIQIPSMVIKNVTINTIISSYLFNDKGNVYQMELKQNFLMGIFNYLSSIKGTIIYESFRRHVENSYNNVKILHLEHSDDYAIAISCKKEQIKDLKTLLTIFMRLGGITDSIKKTTVSDWYCEFVSLYSFNGNCVYPMIKKTKEISSILSGQGFCNDSDAVCSRTSEVVRIGCFFTDALIFHKIQNWLLAYNYSLLPNMTNQNEDLFKIPVQCFGLSEVHPLLYFINKGDPNNLRIFKYTKNQQMLYALSLQNFKEFKNNIEEGVTGFKKPFFINKVFRKKLFNTMRIVKTTLKEGKEFWQQYPALRYYKPFTKTLLEPYLKAFYSINEFQLAYESQSRLSMVMKLSQYVSKKCVKLRFLDNDKIFTIKEAIFSIKEFCKNSSHFNLRPEQLSGGDTAALIFYQVLENSKINRIDEFKNRKILNISNVSPFYYDPIKVDTPIEVLLLKKYNPDIFEIEIKHINPYWDIQKDLQNIDLLDQQFNDLPILQRIHFIYGYIQGMKKPLRSIMTPFSGRKELIEFIQLMLRSKSSINYTFMIEQRSEIRIINPINPTLQTFTFKGKEIPYQRAATLTILAIYLVWRFKNKMTMARIYKSFTVLELTNGQDVISFLTSLKFKELPFLGFKYSEIASLMFMKADLTLDLYDVLNFMRSWNNFTHRYKMKGKLQQNKYVGDTVVEYVHFSSENKACLINDKLCSIITNVTTISRIAHIFAIGLKLLQKAPRFEWSEQDAVALLKKYKMSLTEYKDNLNYLLKYNVKDHDELKVLINDRNGYNFVKINYHAEETEYFPVFSNKRLKCIDKPNIFSEEFKESFEVDTNTASLILRPGGWVICRFGTSNIYTTNEVFVNADQFSLGAVKMSYAIENMKLNKVLGLDLTNLGIADLYPNICIEEVPHQILLKLDIHEFKSKLEYFSDYEDSLNLTIYNESREETKPATSSLIPELPTFEERIKGVEISKDETGISIFNTEESFSSIMGFDMNSINLANFEMAMDSGSSSESEPEDFYKDYDFQLTQKEDEDLSLLPIFKNKEKIWVKHELELPGFLRSIRTEKDLWEDFLDNVIKNMLIDGLYISKFAWLCYSLYFTEFPDYLKFYNNNFLIALINKINNLMKTKPMYPHVEYLSYAMYSLRLEKGIIVMYGAREFTFRSKHDIPPGFILNNHKSARIGEINILEKKFTQSEVQEVYKKLRLLNHAVLLQWISQSTDPILFSTYKAQIPFDLDEKQFHVSWV